MSDWMSGLQRRFRAKRFERIEQMIRGMAEAKDMVRVLDAGGNAGYWAMLSADLRQRVHLTVLNYDEDLKKYDAVVDGLAIDNVAGNACDMPEFDNGSFDLVHSNSVIEHVGSYENMVAFAQETQRVGNAYYVQTPNFWFPVDPHYGRPFIHWLPDPLRIALYQRMNIGYAKRTDFVGALLRTDYTKMLSAGMMRELFKDGKLERERVGFLTKSVIAIREFETTL